MRALLVLIAACGAPAMPPVHNSVREADEACGAVARHLGELQRGEGVEEKHIRDSGVAHACRSWPATVLACARKPTADELMACAERDAPNALRIVRLQIKVARLKARTYRSHYRASL